MYETRRFTMSLYSYITNQILFLTWRDCIEILFFATTFYYLILWLKKDTEKKLLPYFYGYCALTFLTYTMQLSTITYCLFLFSPVIIMLFMLMHQDLLQRNMIALKNITATTKPSQDWLSCIMRNSLKALHDNKEILILIEHTDSLSPYLKSQYMIKAPITDDFMTLLLNNNLCNAQHMVWIKTDGTAQGVHVSWKASWHPASYNNTNEWIDDAVAYTTKTDAVIMHTDAQKQRYTIAYNGKIQQELTVEQAGQIIQKQTNCSSEITKGFRYESSSSKNKPKQYTT